jgi:thiosulfate dehydrogenase
MRISRIIAGSSVIIVISSFLSFKLYKNEKKEEILKVDLSAIPNNQFGDEVRYGRDLMLHTAYFIGPDGIKGKYLGNKMNCTNCHQDAGTKPFSFNLMRSHEQYPQYRAREGKVLTLAERVNNCIERPHNGKPLPLDSREMVALLSYLKWINGFVPKNKVFKGAKNLEISFPERAASSERGSKLFEIHCQRCHGAEGEGKLQVDNMTYIYPPLWGEKAYQPGSSMHRIIKQAQWLKANMPFDKTTWDKPFLSDEEALDIAAFINDDNLHPRPGVKNFDYPHAQEKAIDYDHGPFVDSFTTTQHKLGPYQPIISFWKSKGMNPVY